MGRHAQLLQMIAAPSDGCIVWPYARFKNGYGCVRVDGKNRYTHRVSWAHANGREPSSGMEISHAPIVCHNRGCINPRHLDEKSRAENEHDKVLDETDNRGERHGRSKLTREQALSIIWDSRLFREISVSYGVSVPTISEIKSGSSWPELASDREARDVVGRGS